MCSAPCRGPCRAMPAQTPPWCRPATARGAPAASGLPAGRAGTAGRSPLPTVLPIPTLSFLGLFPPDQVAALGVDLSAAEFDHFGQASLMKGGLCCADPITAVSPRYAREIQTAELGSGIESLLRRLSGR